MKNTNQSHHRSARPTLTPAEQAAKQRRIATYNTLTQRWEECGLDAQKIWAAKLKHSGKEEVCSLAGQINVTGVAYEIKNLAEFKELYAMPHLGWHETQDALTMARLSGCDTERPELTLAKVDDKGRRAVVPIKGDNWELIRK